MVEARQERRRWIALYALCTGMLMIVLDATVVNVALPEIQTDLGFSASGLAWVVNAYLIAFGSRLLLAGRIGDMFGRKRIFMAGLALFTLASLVCGVSQSSGILTQSISWHWIFFVNVPIALATAVAATRLIERDRGIGTGDGADIPGAVLITGALMLGVYTIVKPAADLGWGAGRTLLLGALAIGLLGAFVAREATARNPLIPLRIFRSRNVSGANAVQVLSVAGMFGTFFLGSLYLERVLDYDPLQIGLAFLPMSVVMGTLSIRFSERLVTRFGARTTLVPGLVLIAGSLLLFARAPVDGSYVTDVLPVMLLLGVGAGLAFPALMNLAMSGATPRDAGLASGLVNTTAQVGGALGLAVLATLSATRTDTLTAQGESTLDALTGGYQLAFLIAAGLCAVALVVALVVLRDPPKPDVAAASGASADPLREAERAYEPA